MEYAKVKGLNRKVSRIGLGTWAIGGSMWVEPMNGRPSKRSARH